MDIESKREVILNHCRCHGCGDLSSYMPECEFKGNHVCGNGIGYARMFYANNEEIEALFDVFMHYKDTQGTPVIKSSGNFRTFESGAVRDMGNNGEKGRCDLLPLDIIGAHLEDIILLYISEFQKSGNVGHLYDVLAEIPEAFGYGNSETMLLELAKHFEAGNKKYPPGADGVANWKLGIPVHSFIDSGVRHYLKHKRGDKDEPHDRAFCWNIVCAIWTCEHKPELNGYSGFRAVKLEIDEISKCVDPLICEQIANAHIKRGRGVLDA